MGNFFLERIRLSWYFWIFLVGYTVAALLVPLQTFSSGALALFSVNSFLYGFYIAPILGAQKARVEDLHRVVRSEANAVFSMVLKLKKLPTHLRNELQEMFVTYLEVCISEKKAGAGEKNYEELLSYCIEYKGAHEEEINKLLDALIANQQNRTNFSMQMRNKVFNNEWWIMLVLFGITELFVLTLSTGPNRSFRIIAALLCSGLSMLLVILVKLSTLTHKKAKQVWDPFKKLIDSRFYRID